MNETERKIYELKQLGLKRQQNCYAGHYTIAEFHNGKYESDFVSPYTKSAGNVNSKIVILLQDWYSRDGLLEPFKEETASLGYTPNLQTNINLKFLLSEVFQLQLHEVFVTNVFPFIKPGPMSSKIPQADVFKAYKEFCLPQIRIVKPKLVICCGKDAYISTLKYFKKATQNLLPVCNFIKEEETVFYHQRHTGRIATNASGGINIALSNWHKMKSYFDEFIKK